MPYITKPLRHIYDPAIDVLISTMKHAVSTSALEGITNYVFTRILHALYGLNYSDINKGIGVLECCKLEMYRRVAAPYEDTKIEANGDIEDDSHVYP